MDTTPADSHDPVYSLGILAGPHDRDQNLVCGPSQAQQGYRGKGSPLLRAHITQEVRSKQADDAEPSG